MINNKSINDELKEFAPVLGSLDIIKKVHIEKNYFDDLQNRVLIELEHQKHEENETLNSYFEELPNSIDRRISKSRLSLLKFTSAIAALFILALASIFFLNQNLSVDTINDQNTFVESLEDQDLIYLVDYLGYETELATLIIDDNQNLEINEDITDDMFEYLDENTIIEALQF